MDSDSSSNMEMQPEPVYCSDSSTTSAATAGRRRMGVDDGSLQAVSAARNDPSSTTAETHSFMARATGLMRSRPFAEDHSVFSATGGFDSEGLPQPLDGRDDPLFSTTYRDIRRIGDILLNFPGPSSSSQESWISVLQLISLRNGYLNNGSDISQVPKSNTGENTDSGISIGTEKSHPPLRWSSEQHCCLEVTPSSDKMPANEIRVDRYQGIDAGTQFQLDSPSANPQNYLSLDHDDISRSSETKEEDEESYWGESSWISASSDAGDEIDHTHALYSLKDHITAAFLQKYGEWKRDPGRHPGSTDGTGTVGSPSSYEGQSGRAGDVDFSGPPARLGSSQVSAKKGRRRRSNGNNEDGDGDDEPPRKRQTAANNPKVGPRYILACPFAKRHPSKYRHCYAFVISRIQDVKQHLWRHHQMPIYCRRCRDTFKTEEELDEHATSVVSCEIRQVPVFEGVTMEQVMQLKRTRAPANKSIEEQWYGIYKVLFPDHPLPSSPFIEPGLGHELIGFMDLMYQRGPQIIQNTIRAQALRAGGYDHDHSAALLEASILDGLRTIANEWSLDAGSASPSLTSGETVESVSEAADIEQAVVTEGQAENSNEGAENGHSMKSIPEHVIPFSTSGKSRHGGHSRQPQISPNEVDEGVSISASVDSDSHSGSGGIATEAGIA
ncbi:hypothetical protein ACO1O0_001629 [Amphichorda felina]